MFVGWGHVRAQHERYEDMIRQAEQRRLIRTARAQQPRKRRWHRQFAGWVGGRMVAWGWRLQRHDAMPLPLQSGAAQACCPHAARHP